MKVSDVVQCDFKNWFEKFRKVSIKSVILPIPEEVLSYLLDNGSLVLPEGSQPHHTRKEPELEEEEGQENSVDWDACATTCPALELPQLPEFNRKLCDALEQLGGRAFPKLNWSSPKDASWITLNNTLCCTTPGDIYLLLKSSSFITNDLTTPFQECDDVSNNTALVQYHVVLRQWNEINPAHEFRCFVKNKRLVGISQRDPSQHFAAVAGDKSNILSDIRSFFHEQLENRFPLANFIFDVFRPRKDRVILLDFSPLGPPALSLLFDWPEILQHTTREESECPTIEEVADRLEQQRLEVRQSTAVVTSDSNRHEEEDEENELYNSDDDDSEWDMQPEFRFIADATGVQPGPYMHYGVPVDMVDLSSGQDPLKLIDFLNMKVQKPDDSSSDDEESSLPV